MQLEKSIFMQVLKTILAFGILLLDLNSKLKHIVTPLLLWYDENLFYVTTRHWQMLSYSHHVQIYFWFSAEELHHHSMPYVMNMKAYNFF